MYVELESKGRTDIQSLVAVGLLNEVSSLSFPFCEIITIPVTRVPGKE